MEDWHKANKQPHRIVEKEGKKFLLELSGYIRAHSAYRTSDGNGFDAVCIHAHF